MITLAWLQDNGIFGNSWLLHQALEWSLLLSSNDSAYRRKVSGAWGRNSAAVLPQFAIYIRLDYLFSILVHFVRYLRTLCWSHRSKCYSGAFSKLSPALDYKEYGSLLLWNNSPAGFLLHLSFDHYIWQEIQQYKRPRHIEIRKWGKIDLHPCAGPKAKSLNHIVQKLQRIVCEKKSSFGPE